MLFCLRLYFTILFMEKEDVKKTKIQPVIAGYAAIVIVSILIITKGFAYYQSGSVSIMSSLIDSVLDSCVSIMALASIYYARRPADEDHRWGHGKMEAVSALFQSAIIAGGGAFLVFESINRLYEPVVVTHHMIGIYVMLVSIVLSILLVVIQRYVLRHSNSLAIEADSAHYGSDILINAGVLAVLALGLYGAPTWIDPVFAVLVAGFMAYLASGIARKSLDVLLDRELPDEDRASIIEIIEANNDILGWHDLRTRRNGENYEMSFDIEVKHDASLLEAHKISEEVEHAILGLYPNSEVLIHIDPYGHMENSSRHRVKGIHI